MRRPTSSSVTNPGPLLQLPVPFLALTLLLAASGEARAGAPPQTPAGLEELAEKARSRGTVRIIVGLDVGFRPEGGLGGEGAIRAQHAAIRQAQDRVLEVVSGSPGDVTRFVTVPYLALTTDLAGLEALAAEPAVRSLHEDRFEPALLGQSVPLIGGDDLHGLGVTGQGQAVAVLDTGVDAGHPFFGGRVVEEACFSTHASAEGAFSTCPNGRESQVGAGAAAPCSVAGCEHGTHVAGIAAGRGSGSSGVAPGASILAVQVFTRVEGAICAQVGSPSPCILTVTSDVIEGLEWVFQRRGSRPIAAVNLSLGGGRFAAACDDDPRAAIAANLRSAGIAVVASSGNEGLGDGIVSPACISSVISVGSTSKGDQVNDFSNSAPILDLLAPGGGIRSSVPGGSFAVESGTSMAAPHVAGAFALLRSAFPRATVAEVLAALKSTGKPVRGKGIVRPRIDVAQAATALAGGGGCALFDDLACGGTVSARNDGPGSSDALDAYPCSANNYGGPERIYELVAESSGQVTVTLSGLTADLDLFVLEADAADACDSGDSCLARSTLGGSNAETVTFTAEVGRHYFLIVDGFAGAVSPFTLSVSCSGGGGGGGGGPCAPDAQTLCIDDQPGDRRFRVRMEFQNNQGSGFGNAIPLNSLGVTRGGLFWIGNQGNPEMLIKVLNACQPPFNRYWVFYAATTNQGLNTTVTDTRTGRRWNRTNPRGTAAPPVQDTDAFPCQ